MEASGGGVDGSGNWSGRVVRELCNAPNLALQVADSVRVSRSCGIAIANETKYRLVAPRRFTSSGTVSCMPLQIPPGHTGLIAAHKTRAVARGSVGVLTYDILDLQNGINKLQLMWHVPFDYNLYENLVNVAVGFEDASKDLLDKMYGNDYGMLVRAKDTSHAFHLKSQYKATAMMGDSGHAALSVVLATVAK